MVRDPRWLFLELRSGRNADLKQLSARFEAEKAPKSRLRGTLTYVNEMRNISTIFINGSGVGLLLAVPPPGLDIMSETGPSIAQALLLA